MPTTTPSPIVVVWIYGIAALVAVMAIVGAATRLTDSGLSITEWQPLLGAIPPLSEADWLAAFDKYKTIPEYQLVNQGMSLAAFKAIYWWEWSHRFLGRFIGLYVALPLALFWWRGAISRGLGWKLVGLVALGGLQGGLGWYMVASGLVDRVDVSQYRLALHLAVAVLIFAAALGIAISETRVGAIAVPPSPSLGWRRTRNSASGLLILLFVQIFVGGLVAGLDAGMTANTWPDMDGALVPDGLMVMTPWYLNVFENATTVQFLHRLEAYTIAVWVIGHLAYVLRMPGDPSTRVTAVAVAVGVLAQIGLGIATLLAMVPIGLGLLHQAGALIVIALAVWHLQVLRTVRPA